MFQEYIETKNTVVRCDGGGGPFGHPAVYLNLGKERKIICPYCSRNYVKEISGAGKRKESKKT